MRKGWIFLRIAILIMLNGCYYDKEAILYPSQPVGNCDSSASVTYSQAIAPIINQYCSSCHGSNVYASSGGGYSLDGYNNIKNYAGQNGLLIQSLTFTPGVPQMPNNGSQLSECTVLQIQKWVDAGAPNN